jgi:type IV pilus assembly protein PilB
VRRYQAVPVSFVGDRTLLVGDGRPRPTCSRSTTSPVMTGYEVRPAVASLADVEWLLQRLEDPDFGQGAIAPEELAAADAELAAPSAPAVPAYDIRDNRTPPINFGAAARTRRSSSSCTA